MEKSGSKPQDLKVQRAVYLISVMSPFLASGSRNNLIFLASAVLLYVCVTMIGQYALFPNVQNKIFNWQCFITIFLLLFYVFVFFQSDLCDKVRWLSGAFQKSGKKQAVELQEHQSGSYGMWVVFLPCPVG